MWPRVVSDGSAPDPSSKPSTRPNPSVSDLALPGLPAPRQRKQQEEDQQRAAEEAERAKEAERLAAVEAEKARARDELQGAAGRAQLGEDGALASEVQRLAGAAGANLGLAAGKEEDEDEDMGL